MKTNCIGSLPQAIKGEVPNAAPLVYARYMFAGKTKTSNRIKPFAAKNLNLG